jgi:hypothetical protein
LAAVDARTGSLTSWQPKVRFDPEALAAGAGRVFLGEYASDALPSNWKACGVKKFDSGRETPYW